MKKILDFCICLFLFLFLFWYSNLQAAPFDTGMITLTQPNDVTFTGRIWGDEFIWWAETEDGYRFIETGDGWYYYAMLDQNGEYAATNYKVGIDLPPTSAYQLGRTQARLNEIQEKMEHFNEQIELNKQWFAQKQAEAQEQPVVLKVGVILIEFKDTSHFISQDRPYGYTLEDFDSLMFSYNYWLGDQGNQKHPEEEAIFGSFKDYWYQMSRGKLRIEGKVVNPDTTGNGVPEWIMADSTRSYYADNFYRGHDTLANEAIYKAEQYGYISSTTGSNYYDKLVVVYAQFARIVGALMVHASDFGGKFMILAERSGPNLFGGLSSEKSFTHIGIYAHEFGHNLGLPEEYSTNFNLEYTDILNYCLMGYGIYNGPLKKGECPATLSPYHRLKKNWVSSVPINGDTSDFVVEYNYVNPKLYKINPIYATNGEHYIIESRNREGFDLYTPTDPADSVDQPGRLLVWHHDIDPYPFIDSTDRIMIIPADNEFFEDSKITDFFPKQFSPNNQSLNDTTIPGATLGRVGDNFSNERPAHFSLNGIQKLSNGNTLIDEIKINENLLSDTITVVQNYASGWRVASVPVVLSDYSVQSVFPDADTNSVYKYFAGYTQVKFLENGLGYWVKFLSSTQNSFTGWPLNYLEIFVIPGWNLTGTLSSEIQVSDIYTSPPGMMEGIWGYENGYIPLTGDSLLIPGKAYWTKIYDTTSIGYVILDKESSMPKITSYPDINFAAMDKFIITDSDNYSQTLYVSNIDIDSVLANIDLNLPPIFTELDFDS